MRFRNIVKYALFLTLLFGSPQNPALSDMLYGSASNTTGWIGIRYGWGKVQGVYENSPAWYAGLQPGDKIVEVDGHTDHSDRYIIGDAGTTAVLVIRRDDCLLRVSMIREDPEHFKRNKVYRSRITVPRITAPDGDLSARPSRTYLTWV